jgi:hypothetical protein
MSVLKTTQIMACFFILADILCDIGMVEQLIGLLGSEHSRVHEYLTMALLTIARDNPRLVQECQRPELQLEPLLHERIEAIKGMDEYLVGNSYSW